MAERPPDPQQPAAVSDSCRRILEVAVAVSAANSVEEILKLVIALVGELIPHDRANISLIDRATSTLEILELDVRAGVSERGKRLPLDASTVLGWVALNRRTHVQSTLAPHAAFAPVQVSQQVSSHIITPLLGRTDVLGVLTIGCYRESAFDEPAVALFQSYARLVALAIENLRLYGEARQLAIRDGLTGAFNHRHFQDVLEQEIYRANRYEAPLSLLMIDIDHFKDFNDRFGHPSGDTMICQTVSIITSRLRASDSVYRYGGEEFAVLLPLTGSEAAAVVAAKLLAAIHENNVFQVSATESVTVTVSIGSATSPSDATTRNGLVACADQALYRAKAAGRNSVVSFTDIDEIHGGVVTIEALARAESSLGPESKLWAEFFVHHRRVVELVEGLADALGLPADSRSNLRIAAGFHDLGELGLPPGLCNKKGPINSHERTIIQTHPVVSETLLRRSFQIGSVLKAVLHHHERYDGTGYPSGLAGEEIPVLARIIAVADTFDALTSPRPYRPEPLSAKEAFAELRREAGFQLDPVLVEAFIARHSAST